MIREMIFLKKLVPTQRDSEADPGVSAYAEMRHA